MTKIVEDLIRELQALGKQRPHPPEELARAKEIMIELKQNGFLPKETSLFSDGGWSEFSVRNYVEGIRVQNSESKENVISFIGQVIKEGITFEHIHHTMNMRHKLEESGVTLDDISALLAESLKAKLPFDELVALFLGVKKTSLSFPQLSEAVVVKAQLDATGFTNENGKLLSDTAKAYGHIHDVLNAVKVFGTLKAIEASITSAKNEENSITKNISDLTVKTNDLEAKRTSIEAELNLHKQLVELGFTEEILMQLLKLSNKFDGPKGILDAVRVFGSLDEISAKVADTGRKLREVKGQLNQVQSEHAHLMPVVTICDALLYKFGLSVDAVEDLLKLAKLHGQPLEVLRAVGKFGEMKNIQAEIDKLISRKEELEGKIALLKREVEKLRSLLDETKRVAEGILTPFTNELTSSVELLRKKFSETVDGITSKYKEYYERLGELKAEAGALTEEIRIARIVSAMVKYPSEAKTLPIDYALLMIGAVAKYCRANDFNYRVTAGDLMQKKYFISSYKEVELLDLLEWSERGLRTGIQGGQK